MTLPYTHSRPFEMPMTPFDPVSGRHLSLGVGDLRVRIFKILDVGERFVRAVSGERLVSLDALNGGEVGSYAAGQYVAAIRLAEAQICVVGEGEDAEDVRVEWLILGSGGGGGDAELFDLVDVGATSFSVLGTGQSANAAWLTGVATAITGSGLTWDGTDRWASGTIAASQYVWLELDSTAGTATIKKGTALPAGSATLRVCPLWYVPFADSVITKTDVVDLRHAMETRGGGGAANPSTEVDTLGSSSEGSETASSDTWTAGNESGHGLALWHVCRVVYDEAGDKVLYAFLRLMTFDSRGMLYSVSAETRVTVDTPVVI